MNLFEDVVFATFSFSGMLLNTELLTKKTSFSGKFRFQKTLFFGGKRCVLCKPSKPFPTFAAQTAPKEKRHVELLKARGAGLEFFVSGMLDEKPPGGFFCFEMGDELNI